LSLLLPVAASLAAQSDFKLRNGDRVLFYGDSITEQHLYTNDVETFVVTRFPGLNVHFRNTGVGGDRVTGGWAGGIDVRLPRDFYAHQPTVATIMLGMNDGSYTGFNQGIFDTYANGYTKIVAGIKQNDPGCRLFLIQPSPFDDVTRKPNWDPGYNSVLQSYGQFVKDLAAKNGCDAVNFNEPLVAVLEKALAADEKNAQQLIPDRVHPAPAFQLLMAEQILKAWNAPAVVADVAIDFRNRVITKADNSKVKLTEGLEWTQLDGSLPFPLRMDDKLVALAMQSSDFVDQLDKEMLTVTGLPANTYDLKIDGKTVGTFSREQLEAGINLAVIETPMVEQARRVGELTDMHNSLFMRRWRDVQMPWANEPKLGTVLGRLDAGEESVVTAQRDLAKPVLRHFRLVAL
jgi:lysophospholipase L1-like esterase